MKLIKKKNNLKSKTVSEILIDFVRQNEGKATVTVKDIEVFLGAKGFAIILLIFSLPLCIPIPIPPGFSTICAVPLVIFSFQMTCLKQHPWLPKWFSEKTLKFSIIQSLQKKATPIMCKIERFTKPRLIFLSSRAAEAFLGFFCLICSISIANPIPLTNMIPAIAVSTISFGIINQDGVIIIAGILIGIIGLIVTIIVTFFGSSFLFSFLK